jgi:hypothetical protein
MKSRYLYLQAVFAVVVAVAMTTACGKQDGAKPTSGAAPLKKDVPAARPSKTEDGSEIDRNSKKSVIQPAPREDRGTTNVGKLEEREPDSGAGPSSDADSVSGGVSVSGGTILTPEMATEKIRGMDSRVDSVVYYDPSGMTPDQIFARKNQVVSSGAFVGEKVASDIQSGLGETLFYSGAGHDTLREQLYLLVNNYESQLDEETRKENRALAQSIQLSNFSVNWETRRGLLSFQYLRNGRKATVDLEADVTDVMQFRVGSLSKDPYIMADVACMDISGGCKTVHIKIQEASSGKIRRAHMLARHTSASLFIEGNAPGISSNREYDRLMNLLLNTTKNPRGTNVVNKLTLTTSETIGGASNFWVTMDFDLLLPDGTRGFDQIQVTGPLAKPKTNDNVDVGAVVSPALTVIEGQVIPVDGRLVDTIRNARIMKNDGRGNLQLQLNVRSAASGALEDQIKLTISRVHTPTVQLRLPVK